MRALNHWLCDSDTFNADMFRVLKKLASTGKKTKESSALQFSQILGNSKDTPLLTVLETVAEAIELAADVDETDKDVAVGRALAHATIIQSGRIQKGEEASVKVIMKDLMRLRMRGDEAATISVHTIIQLIKIVPADMFASCMWPKLERILAVGWTNCTPDRLNILLTCLKYHPERIAQDFISSKWGCSDIVSSGNYSNVTVLLQSMPRPDMALMNSIVEFVFDNKNCKVKAFWPSVTGTLLKHRDTQSQDVGIALVHCGITHFKTPKQLLMILSPQLFSCVLKRFSVPRKKLKDATLQPIKDMLGHLVSRVSVADDTLQTTIVNHFIDNFEHVGFDEATHTKTLSALIHHLSRDAAMRLADKLKTILITETMSKNIRFWSLAQLTSLITLPSLGVDTDMQTSLLCYLAQHALFVEKHGHSDIDTQLRTLILKQLYKALNNLATYKPAGTRRDPLKYINMVHTVVAYIQKMMANEEFSLANETMPDTMEEWSRMYKRVHKMRKKTSGDQLTESHAFQLLCLHMGLQLFSEPQHAIQILKDVYHCYDKAFTKRRQSVVSGNSSDNDDDPEWIDVVTEVLVSLLCQSSHLARKVSQTVYSLLHEHISLSSIDIIINVLIPDEEDSDVMFVNDDDDDDDDSDASGDPKMSDVDSGVEDDQGSVDNAFRRTVEAALGPGALAKDDEGDDAGDDGSDDAGSEDGDDAPDNVSDMSDETMLRLDSTLSEVFRSQFKNKKDAKLKKEQIINLKLRVLDLIEGITRPATLAKGKVLVNLLKPLLLLMDQGNDADAQAISNKAHLIYYTILKQKRHIVESALDTEELAVIMSDLIDLSKSSYGLPTLTQLYDAYINIEKPQHSDSPANKDDLIDATAKGYMLLVSCILNQQKTPGAVDDVTTQQQGTDNHNEAFGPLCSLLRDCLYKTDAHLRENFFKKIIQLGHALMWPLTDVLVECIGDFCVKVYKKTQAALMLSALLNKSVVTDIGMVRWTAFIHTLMDSIKQVVGTMQASELRPKLLYTVLDVLVKCVTVDRSTAQLIPSESVEKLASLQVNMNKDCTKLWNRIQAHLYPSTCSQSEPKKRQHKHKETGQTQQQQQQDMDTKQDDCGGSKKKRRRVNISE